jgi:hypothetical protein
MSRLNLNRTLRFETAEVEIVLHLFKRRSPDVTNIEKKEFAIFEVEGKRGAKI